MGQAPGADAHTGDELWVQVAMGEGKPDCCQAEKVLKRCVSPGSHGRCVGKQSWKEGQFCKDTVGGKGEQYLFSYQKICVLYLKSYIV